MHGPLLSEAGEGDFSWDEATARWACFTKQQLIGILKQCHGALWNCQQCLSSTHVKHFHLKFFWYLSIVKCRVFIVLPGIWEVGKLRKRLSASNQGENYSLRKLENFSTSLTQLWKILKSFLTLGGENSLTSICAYLTNNYNLIQPENRRLRPENFISWASNT